MSKLGTRAALAGSIAALMLVPAAALAQSMTYSGMIISSDAHSITVRMPDGDKKVRINPETKIRSISGVFGGQKKTYPQKELVRGLAVDVVGTQEGSEIVAQEVNFKEGSMKTAKQIHAGLHETEGRVSANAAGVEANARGVAENADRIDNVGDLMAAGRTKVFFPVGSYAVSSESQSELCTFAEQAKNTKGYRLAIVGRADPTGNAAANKRLSLRRAEAVKAHLIENCGILPGRVVPSTALGESTVAQDPDPPKNDSEARRVTVTIMVSKSSRQQPGGD